MAVLFLVTLVFSIIGICTLLVLKSWELRTGKMLAESMRPNISAFFHAVLFWIERVIPTLVRAYARYALRVTLSFVHRAVAFLVLWAERALERVLHLIHRSTDVQHRAAGEASAFLREVAEHKHKLLRAQRGQVRLHKK